MKRGFSLAILLFVLISPTRWAHSSLASPAAGQAIAAPVLKWTNGGCYSSWCETGWYSSPAVADLDGDGAAEVIGSAYTIFVLNGSTGGLKWSMPSGHDRSQPGASSVGRTWPGIVVADIDGNGDLEIVTAHSGGYVSVYNQAGYFEPGWPQRPTDRELRGLSVADLDGDGKMEIVVTGAVSSQTNTWIYEPDGALRPGWPQLSDDSGYAYGVFNDNAALGDLNGDGSGEVVVPSDVHYVCAYDSDGVQLPANPMYAGKGWGKVGVWESLDIELRGWGTCDASDSRAERYRANFAAGASDIADVNGDGVQEAVVVGNMYDCISGYPSRYNGVFIFNADRSRFNQDGYDWRTVPLDTGAPLSEDYNVIENEQPNPVVADLDGDGEMEILYPSYDGRVHAFWLDKTEHGSWPYSVYKPAEGFYRFASEPVVADLDGDGKAEVIFTSWAQKSSKQTGMLTILNYLGDLIHEAPLPPAYGSPDWNGGLPAPTLANIDSDPDLEVVVNTAHSGLVAYDLPGTSNAAILWGTGRGSYQRSGALTRANLTSSKIWASSSLAVPGQRLTYNILLRNSGLALKNVSLTDTLPSGVSYAGNLSASSGMASEAGGVVSWQGSLAANAPVTISFDVVVDNNLSEFQVITNSVAIDDGLSAVWRLQASIYVNGSGLFLPLLSRGSE